MIHCCTVSSNLESPIVVLFVILHLLYFLHRSLFSISLSTTTTTLTILTHNLHTRLYVSRFLGGEKELIDLVACCLFRSMQVSLIH